MDSEEKKLFQNISSLPDENISRSATRGGNRRLRNSKPLELCVVLNEVRISDYSRFILLPRPSIPFVSMIYMTLYLLRVGQRIDIFEGFWQMDVYATFVIKFGIVPRAPVRLLRLATDERGRVPISLETII